MKHYAIIVAGGSGSRMQADMPKQFLLLSGKPILMYTIGAFYRAVSRPVIIVVLHSKYHQYWKQLCISHSFNVPHKVIEGGETRFHSVKNGLSEIQDDDAIIAVHDAVRPLTSQSIIDGAYQCAALKGNAVVAVKSRDSIRQKNGDTSVNLLRENIYLVQTPQVFKASQLKKAYEQPYTEFFTDDASVVEQSGEAIHLIEGNYQNIKITFPEDIPIAEFLLSKMAT